MRTVAKTDRWTMRAHMLIAATLLLVAPALAKSVEIFTTSDLPALAHMNFTQMCQAFDQPCEQHEVTTEDGYILTIFRIKGDPKRPVLMWHGLPDSSDTFLVRGHNSTSATLAAAGYDVWVANSRGNKYSRRHKDWDPDKNKEKFWDFSIQEMGYYDIPATIDYILNETGEEKLSAIAHSMGTTIFFVLGSTRPEYNNKLKVFIPMAPVAFTTRMTSALSIGNRNWPVFRMGLVLTNTYEVMSSASIENTVLRFFCGDKIIGSLICKQIIVAAIGGEISDIEPELFEAAFARYLSGTSRKNIDHLAQIYNTGRFSKFSFGLADNRLKYGALYPPDYELKNMKTPVVMVCGQNDILADLEDIELLKKGLPNVAAQHILKDISHFDLVWGRNLNTYLHPLLKETLNKYS